MYRWKPTAALLAVIALALAIGSAGAQNNSVSGGPESVHFPWIPNGEMIDGVGPWYAEITLTNLEPNEVASIEIYAGNAPGNGAYQLLHTTELPTYGSEKISSFDLSVPEPGASVIVTSTGQNGDSAEISAVAKTYTISDGFPPAALDHTWSSPPPMTGSLPSHANENAHNVVPFEQPGIVSDGYNALTYAQITANEMPLESVLPFVSYGDGWDTRLRIATFSDEDELFDAPAAFDIVLREHDSDETERITSTDFHVERGDTFSVSLSELVDDDFTGSAIVVSDAPTLGVIAERMNADDGMRMTSTGNPRDSLSIDRIVSMLMPAAAGWTSTISVVNEHRENSHWFEIERYNAFGQLQGSDTLSDLGPGGMGFIRYPADSSTFQMMSARIDGTGPFQASVDHQSDESGDAFTYQPLPNTAKEGGMIVFPSVEHGDPTTGQGTFTGITLFNPNEHDLSTGELQYYDENGQAVLQDPSVFSIGPLSSITLYTPSFSELPADFSGTAVVEVIGGGGSLVPAMVNSSNDLPGDGAYSFEPMIFGALTVQPSH